MVLPYTAVFFDLGYTLVETDRELTLGKTLRGLGISREHTDLARAYHWVDKFYMREQPGLLGKSPTVFYRHYLSILLGLLRVDADVSTVFEQLGQAGSLRGNWRLIDGAKESLLQLKEEGFRLGLISNWDASARAVLNETGLAQLFDCVVISSEVGTEKPNPQIFLHALNQLGQRPDRALYVGDNYYDDVIGARQVGMDAVVINRFGRFGIEEIADCDVFGSVKEVTENLMLTQDGISRLRVRKL